VIGRENIPEGSALICANHTRNSDPFFIVFALTKRVKLKIMAKEEMTRWPIVGPILSKVDLMIWVKRGKADIGAVKAALKALKGEEKLLIFPEGTRSEEIGEGKTGAAMMAIRAGVPIIPVYVPAKKRWFRRTPIVIGEAYYPFVEERKPTLEDYRMVTKDLMQRIGKLEEKLR
jgi:1-acyl-sn-glycerol-3-phosphate acyltransferase